MTKRRLSFGRGRAWLAAGLSGAIAVAAVSARAQAPGQIGAPNHPAGDPAPAQTPKNEAAALPAVPPTPPAAVASMPAASDPAASTPALPALPAAAPTPLAAAAPVVAETPEPTTPAAATPAVVTPAAATPAAPVAVLASPAPTASPAAPVNAPATETTNAVPPAPPPSVAQAAPPPPPPVLLVHPDVLETGKLAADGQVVPLFGVIGESGESAQGLKSYIKSSGDRVACQKQAGGTSVCALPDGTDVAMVALINGAAQASAEAPDAYREQESAAQAARRGIWSSLPPPPVPVSHPIVRDTATLRSGSSTYLLEGIEGVAGQPANELQGYLAANGDALTCQQQGASPYYNCLLPDGTDLAKVVLVNGAGRVSPDAPDSYRVQQREAMDNKRGIWATMPPAQVAFYETQLAPAPSVAFADELGPASDGITYVGDQPTAVIDGELVFLAFAGVAGWGYYDHFHHWHGAPDRFERHLERFHPEGRGLRGYGPGGVREAHLGEGLREGVHPASFGRPAEIGRPGFGEHPEMARPGLARAEIGHGEIGRPEMGRPEMARPGMVPGNRLAGAQTAMVGRPAGGFVRPAGTPAFAARPGTPMMPTRTATPMMAPRPAPAVARPAPAPAVRHK